MTMSSSDLTAIASKARTERGNLIASTKTDAEAAYIAANAAAEEVYNASRSRAYAAYAAALDGGAYAAAEAPERYEMYITAYAVLADSVEDAEIARDAALDANYARYLASCAAADAIWPGAVAESTP